MVPDTSVRLGTIVVSVGGNKIRGACQDNHIRTLAPFVVFASCLDRNMSKRPGEMSNEQVSAKSKPLRGHCRPESKDGSALMKKEVGRNEENPGDTAW